MSLLLLQVVAVARGREYPPAAPVAVIPAAGGAEGERSGAAGCAPEQ